MILVDTSALIGYLRGDDSAASYYLDALIERDGPFYLTPVVVQEVLQGARDEREWRRLHRYLGDQLSIATPDPEATHVAAARIYFDCRRRGASVRSSIDCLIAQIALENDFALLHDDRDFESIRRVRRLTTLP